MKKIFLPFSLMFVLFYGFSVGNAQEKIKVAVLSFEAKNLNQETADAVTEILSTELFNSNRFKVVERQAIQKMLEEQSLQMTGVTDMSQAARIGKVLNVEKIMIGSVSRLGETYIINTRIVDVETGVLELAQNAKCSGEGELPKAIADLVGSISQKVTIEGSIIKISSKVILFDLGKDHGVKNGQVFTVFRIGDVVTDLSGSVIGKAEDEIGLLRVTNVQQVYSEAEAVMSDVKFRLGDKVRLSSTKLTDEKPKERKKEPTDSNDKKKPAALPPVF